jgi:hypothetical protein
MINRIWIKPFYCLLLSVTFLGMGNALRVHHAFAQADSLPAALDLHIVIDESTSMWNRNDPEARRIDAVETLIDTLGALPAIKTRVSIVFFGDQATTITSPRTLDTAQARVELKDLLRQQHEQIGPMGWTNIIAAWDQVFAMVQQQHSASTRSAILILTDGQPETGEANSFVDPEGVALQKLLAATRDAYQRFRSFEYTGTACASHTSGQGIPLYVVGAREGAQQQTTVEGYDNIWQELADNSGGIYYRAPEDVNQLPDLLVRLVNDLVCVPVPAQPETFQLSPDNPNLEYPIPATDLVEGLAVVVLKDDQTASLDIRLLQPDKTIYAPDDRVAIRNASAGDEVWGLQRHIGWAGSWTLSINNTSGRDVGLRIRLLPVSPQFSVRFDQPSEPIHPRGKELPIQIRVEDREGRSLIESLEGVILQVSNRVANQSVTVDLTQHGDVLVGAYANTFLLDPMDQGDRDINFNAFLRIGNLQLPVQSSQQVTFNPWPWLSVLEPSIGHLYVQNQAIPLIAQVWVEDRPDAVTAQMATVNASVCCDGAGNPIWEGPLALDLALGESALSAAIPADQLPVGNYTVTYTLLPSDTAPRQDVVERALMIGTPSTPTPTLPPPPPTATPLPTPTPTPTPPPPTFAEIVGGLSWLLPWAGALFGLVLFSSGISMIRARPTLNGMALTSSYSGEERFLRNYRFGAYRFDMGTLEDGSAAARLAIQPRRTPDRGVVARVTVEWLGSSIDGVSVGATQAIANQFGLNQVFDWRDGESIFVGGEQITLYNPNEVNAAL